MTIERLAIGEALPLVLGPDGEPPTELRLFRKGTNPSTKGDYVFDDEAAKAVMDTYRQMGRDWVTIDYDHGSLLENPVDPSKSGKSAGTARLELRDGELWAVGIKFTPAAREAIKNGEWPSISPAFERGEDRRPTWLINFALTANPSLHSPSQLIAANVLRSRMLLRAIPYERHTLDERATWDATASEGRVRRWASSDGTGDRETIDWDRYGKAFGWVDPAMRENFGGYKLLHHDVVDGRLVDVKPGIQAAAAALQGARGGVDLPPGDVAAVRRHIAQHYAQWGEKAPWERRERMNVMHGMFGQMLMAKGKTAKDLADWLGISEEEAMALMLGGNSDMSSSTIMASIAAIGGIDKTAKPDVVVERLSGLASTERALLETTGAKSGKEALGIVAALKLDAGKVVELNAKVQQLEGEKVQRRVTEALSAAKAGKKITPAEEAELAKVGAKDPEWLEGYLKAKSPIEALNSMFQQPAAPAGGGPPAVPPANQPPATGVKTWETLSNVEKHDLRCNNPEQYKALADDYVRRNPAAAKQFAHHANGNRPAPL